MIEKKEIPPPCSKETQFSSLKIVICSPQGVYHVMIRTEKITKKKEKMHLFCINQILFQIDGNFSNFAANIHFGQIYC